MHIDVIRVSRVLLAVVSLAAGVLVFVFRILAWLFTNSAYDDPDDILIIPEGSYYNYRKGRFDNGLDPNGHYDDIDHPDGDLW